MRNLKILCACVSVVLHLQSSSFSREISSYSPPIYYDVTTGDLTMDVTDVPGGVISAYALGSNMEDMFLTDEYTPFMNTNFNAAFGGSIGEGNFAGINGGVYSVGNVLPAGLSETELRAVLEQPSDYVGRPNLSLIGEIGTGIQHVFDLVYAPSPLPPLNVEGAPSHDRWATEVTLAYDILDGSLELNTTGSAGGAISIYEINANDGHLVADAFKPVLGTVFEADEKHLTEIGFGGIPEGKYDLGAVLPPGLSANQLGSVIGAANFIGHPGHSGQIDLGTVGIPMSIQVVPEPSSFTFVAAIFVYACSRRPKLC